MNYADLVRHYFPDATDKDIEYILWEKTGYPEFFETNKWCPTPLARLRKQLRQFKYSVRRHKLEKE